ncbi:ornithine cyclodeaminase family protein [Actinomadura sp. SCN-SB]|uniref:ornithine cyclodeaminase family protein n=1 Tax=Actinomadura sp. SCN-SB TaxID=3373092 RepID=UPI0037521B39
MTELLMLSAADVEKVFDVSLAIESQREAFGALGRGDARLAPRALLPGPDGDIAFSYASRLPGTGPIGKFGSVNPGNAARGLPSVHALVTVLDPDDGRPVAIIEGEAVTTLRTSAASAVAADHLAVPDASSLAVIGHGVQGRAHVRALAQVRPLTRVRLAGRDKAACARAAASLGAELDLPVEAVSSAREAVSGAGLVATCTTSFTPVLEASWLAPGCTVLSVGSFAPDRREVGPDLLDRAAAVVVDDVATARAQAGPLVDVPDLDLVPLGDVVTGAAAPRRSPDDVIFYNSVGLGVQDAAAAARIVALAAEAGVGRRVAL